MNLWAWIVLACVAAFLTKWLGYAIPGRLLQNPRMTQIAACMTVALLTALTVMNTVALGQSLVLDARLAAFGVAALALWRRLPFLVVVVFGAATAALVRLV
ncbi:MAG: AzlD domain-containing protein [Comamonas sp.]|jgi:branched-subunit amino acid transport protein AzlD|nr:AzlD domain-containing protein [Comamonas sp.]